MIALCSTSVVILETSFSVSEENVVRLIPKYTHTFHVILTTGTVIVPHGSMEETEVWCCPLRGGFFKVLSQFDSRMFNAKDILIPPSDISTETCIYQVSLYIYILGEVMIYVD